MSLQFEQQMISYVKKNIHSFGILTEKELENDFFINYIVMDFVNGFEFDDDEIPSTVTISDGDLEVIREVTEKARTDPMLLQLEAARNTPLPDEL
jgi:hypothetical protein